MASVANWSPIRRRRRSRGRPRMSCRDEVNGPMKRRRKARDGVMGMAKRKMAATGVQNPPHSHA